MPLETQEDPEEIIPSLNPMEEYISMINIYVNQWKAKQTPEQIRDMVFNDMDKKKKEILLKLMGFDKDWHNEFKLDHCNGRSGNSIAGDYLQRIQKESIEAWLDQCEIPKLTKKELDEITKSLRAEYVHRIKMKLRDLVFAQAEKDAKTLLEAAIPTPDLTGIIAAQKFLTSKN